VTPSEGAVDHPHDLRAPIPERLDPAEIRRLSALDPARALRAISEEWLGIAAAIAASVWADAWPVTVLAVVFIGARQHALLVLAHDASHFRLLPGRQRNDWVGNVLLAWPMFVSVQGFRHYHGDHHRFLQRDGDGNRALWGTHGPDGQLVPEWRYPKSPGQLAWTLLRRAALLTGLFWMVRGLLGGFLFGVPPAAQVVRAVLWAAVLAGLASSGAWGGFFLYWVLPYCTWHVLIQYLRLICEHSAVRSGDPRYADTRTTIPGPLGRWFVLPRHIGYHLAHHWYPSVPFYRLPELHARLEARPGFRSHARVFRSIPASLRDVTSTGFGIPARASVAERARGPE
jgi:fatty acid desaturase